MIASRRATLAVLAGACGVGALGSAARAQAAPITLDFPSWQAEEPGVSAWWRDVIAAYHAANPNVRINLYSIPFTQFVPQMTVRFTGRNPPDIVHLPARNFAPFASQGWLLPIDQRLAATDIPRSWNSLQSDMAWEGKAHGILLMAYGTLLYCNERLLRQAGLGVPTTPEEFLVAAERTTDRAAGQFGIVGVTTEHPNLVGALGAWVMGRGLDWTRGNAWALDDPAVIAAADQYRAAMRFAPPGTNSNQARQLFIDGKAAFLYDGPWIWPLVERAPEAVRRDLRVARMPFPRNTGGSSNGLHMPAGLPAAKQDAVWRFMQLLAEPAWQERYTMLSGAPAGRTGAVTAATAERLPHLSVIQEAAAGAVSTFGTLPAVRENYNEFATMLGRGVIRLLSTDAPTADVLRALNRDLARAIPLA